MVETTNSSYLYSYRLLQSLASLMVGGVIAQALTHLIAYFSMDDTQAGGMIAHLVMQHLSYYFLGCAFVILSLSNILIKRGMSQLKTVRVPALMLIICVSVVSFLLIPRMDFLRETALQDGMPVMASSLAHYFAILSSLTMLLLGIQILSSILMAWKLGVPTQPKHART